MKQMARSTVGTHTHAIVIGGGMAGLLATYVLTKHFDKVTLVERDHYPQEPTSRPGVPQSRQVHTMLLRGQQLLESWFPGFSKKLLAHGATEQWYGYKSIYVYGKRRSVQIPPIFRGWNCSRMLLEWQVRQEIVRLDAVGVVEGVEVIGFLYEPQQATVCGVQVRQRQRGENTENNMQDIVGDLVVDASGAASRTLQWLQDIGYEAPQETVVDSQLGYATQTYEPPQDFQADWTGIAIQAMDENKHGGVLMRVEGGLWMVVLAGANKDYPPTQQDAFLAFAQSLPDPALYEAMKVARPVTPIYGYRRTANRLRHFERLKRFPENLVIIGDAVCSFNPVYGQGMTVAALEAEALDICLQQYREKKQLKGFSRKFQRRIARTIRLPWLFVSTADAPKKEKQGLASKYMDCIIASLSYDQDNLQTFLEVLQMLRSPLALLNPRIAIKNLTHHKRL